MDGSHARWRKNVWRTIVFEYPNNEKNRGSTKKKKRCVRGQPTDRFNTLRTDRLVPRARNVPRTANRSPSVKKILAECTEPIISSHLSCFHPNEPNNLTYPKPKVSQPKLKERERERATPQSIHTPYIRRSRRRSKVRYSRRSRSRIRI
jgi:hypothetical protein